MVNTIKFSEFNNIDLANSTNQLVGESAPTGGQNIKSTFPLRWDASTQPVAPLPGTLGYNTSLGQYEFWNGLAWIQLAAGGSGAVNVGAKNEIAYYPNNGTSVSGLLNNNNAALVTSLLGVPTMSVATGTGAPVKQTSPTLITPNLGVADADSVEFNTTDGIIGTTTNNNASVGSVGELVSSVIPFVSSVSLSTSTPANLTSIVLHAGDWDVWGNIVFTASVGMSGYSCWLNTLSATQPDTSLLFANNFTSAISLIGSGTPPTRRFSLSVPTTIYLSGVAVFPVGTASICGGIYARVRR